MGDRWAVGEDTAQVLQDEISSLNQPGNVLSPNEADRRWSYTAGENASHNSRDTKGRYVKRTPRRAFSLAAKDPFTDSVPSKRLKTHEEERRRVDDELLQTLQSAKRRLDSPFSTSSPFKLHEPTLGTVLPSIKRSQLKKPSLVAENSELSKPGSSSHGRIDPVDTTDINDFESLLRSFDGLGQHLAEFRAELGDWPLKLRNGQQNSKESLERYSTELNAAYEARYKKDVQEAERQIKEYYSGKIASLNAALEREHQEKKDLIKACDAFLTARGR